MFSTTHVAVGLALVLALGYALHVIDRTRWKRTLTGRFVYGVPWGTAITVALLFAFYLFAQHGLQHWDQPVIYPYISWSYFYPTGLLTAGVAHGSPAHIVSNATATVVFGVIAEYTWGHYPPAVRETRREAATRDGTSGDRMPDREPADHDGRTATSDRPSGWASSPLIRALVIFPGVLFAIALLTAVFSLGPGLGFSGAVYAIVGFTIVTTPRLAVGGVVGTAALGVLYDAITNPIVTAGIESGAPSPPGWAGVGFQAHMLGFLLGALCAIALLRRRRRSPSAGAIFGGLVLVGLVQSLWLLVWSGGLDTYTLYRGAGVTFLFGLAVVTTVAAAGSTSRLPRPAAALTWMPSRQQLAIGWIGLLTVVLGLFVVAMLTTDEAYGFVFGMFLAGYALLVIPALPPLLPNRLTGGPVSYRQAALLTLCVLTAVVALVSVPFGFTLVDGQPTGTGDVEIREYTVTYEENASIDRTMLGFPENATNTTYGGLLVASDEQEVFTVGERAAVIDHAGEATIAVGGPGWYETVHAERSGWDVLGNETAYVVDLTVDGETTRSYASDPVQTGAQFGEERIVVAPTTDGFEVRFIRADETTTVPVPELNASQSVDSFVVTTESADEVDRIVVSHDGVTVPIAERETY